GHEAQPPGPLRQTVLNLLQCPWCIGFWISTALLAALALTTGTQMVITGTWWVDLAIASLASSYIIGWLSDQEDPLAGPEEGPSAGETTPTPDTTTTMTGQEEHAR